MKQILLVALGGALGSAGRYCLSGWVLHHSPNWRFPLGTFTVNVIGCLFVGILAGLMVKHDLLTQNARLFLVTGIAGGFTTFSAFGLETFHLLRRDELWIAFGYVASSIIVGLLLLGLGYYLISARTS